MDLHLIAEELKKANVYLENIFENSPDAIGIVDRRGRFIRWNKMAAELYGYTFEQLLGKSTFDLYPDKKELNEMLTLLRRDGTVKKRELKMQRKDGTIVPFEISITLLKDDQNQTVGSVCVARDLSEIKKVLDELRASNEELSKEIAERRKAEDEVRRLSRQNQLILDTAGEGIVGLDVFGRVTFINPAGAETLGYTVEELLARDLHDLVHHSRPDGTRYPLHECPMFQSLSTGNTFRERDEIFWRKDGSSYPVAYSSTPIREKNYVIGAVITFRDITLPKRKLEHLTRYRDHLQTLVEDRNAELERVNAILNTETGMRCQAEEDLQELSQTLRLFAYSIAHDLKQPAAGIELGAKRIRKLCRKLTDEKLRDRVLRVSDRVLTMAARINTFVDANRVPFSMVTIDCRAMLKTIKARFSDELDARNIAWLEPLSTIPRFKADASFLPLAVCNLVESSLKCGGEELSRIKLGYEESEEFHVLSVTSDGTGLSDSRLGDIFGFFHRHDRSGHADGTGLALATAGKIARRHGGRLKIKTGPETTISLYISKNL